MPRLRPAVAALTVLAAGVAVQRRVTAPDRAVVRVVDPVGFTRTAGIGLAEQTVLVDQTVPAWTTRWATDAPPHRAVLAAIMMLEHAGGQVRLASQNRAGDGWDIHAILPRRVPVLMTVTPQPETDGTNILLRVRPRRSGYRAFRGKP